LHSSCLWCAGNRPSVYIGRGAGVKGRLLLGMSTGGLFFVAAIAVTWVSYEISVPVVVRQIQEVVADPVIPYVPDIEGAVAMFALFALGGVLLLFGVAAGVLIARDRYPKWPILLPVASGALLGGLALLAPLAPGAPYGTGLRPLAAAGLACLALATLSLVLAKSRVRVAEYRPRQK
jgi:hypothetical protein